MPKWIQPISGNLQGGQHQRPALFTAPLCLQLLPWHYLLNWHSSGRKAVCMGYIWSLIFPRQPPLLVDENFLASAGRISWRDCNHFEGIEIYIFSRSAISIKSTFSRSSSTLSLASTSSQRLSPIDSIIKHMRWPVWLFCFSILTVLNLAANIQYNYFVGKDLWGHCSLDGTQNGDG